MDIILIFIIIACLASAVYYALLIPIAVVVFLIFMPKWWAEDRDFKERFKLYKQQRKERVNEIYGPRAYYDKEGNLKFADIDTSMLKKEDLQ
jgi:hypothetical protein